MDICIIRMHVQEPFIVSNGIESYITSLNVSYGTGTNNYLDPRYRSTALGESCGSVAIPASSCIRGVCTLVVPIPSICLTTDTMSIDFIAYSNFGIRRLYSERRG
jgi:hypothetical protein